MSDTALGRPITSSDVTALLTEDLEGKQGKKGSNKKGKKISAK